MGDAIGGTLDAGRRGISPLEWRRGTRARSRASAGVALGAAAAGRPLEASFIDARFAGDTCAVAGLRAALAGT